jgi:hypothetical protein
MTFEDDNPEDNQSCLNWKWTIEPLHRFMFYPTTCCYMPHDERIGQYKIIRPNDNQCSIARIAETASSVSRCLVISHGNAGTCIDRISLMDALEHYPGDIYCYEYDGFGVLGDKSVSIPNCVRNHLFWLDYLRPKYAVIDLWGESIGGGIVMETLDYLRDNDYIKFDDLHNALAENKSSDYLLIPRIKSVYLQSTFSSIRSLLSSFGSILYYLYCGLFLNDLDTQSRFAKFSSTHIQFNILHSRVDDIIPYSEAQQNYAECIKNRVSAKFWNIGGGHNMPTGLDSIVFQ